MGQIKNIKLHIVTDIKIKPNLGNANEGNHPDLLQLIQFKRMVMFTDLDEMEVEEYEKQLQENTRQAAAEFSAIRILPQKTTLAANNPIVHNSAQYHPKELSVHNNDYVSPSDTSPKG